MQIDIQVLHFSVTDSMRSHIDRRLHFCLTFCDDHIQRVVMRLSDINGRRSGPDNRAGRTAQRRLARRRDRSRTTRPGDAVAIAE
jgi:putative sigma-54 modulation protein